MKSTNTPVTVPFTRCFVPCCFSGQVPPPHRRQREQSTTTSPSARGLLLSSSGALWRGPAQLLEESRAVDGSRSVSHKETYACETATKSANAADVASTVPPPLEQTLFASFLCPGTAGRAATKRHVGQLRLARRGLVLASAALTPSGRLQLLPHEAEVKYGDKVDAEFPEPGGGLAGDAALKYTVRRAYRRAYSHCISLLRHYLVTTNAGRRAMCDHSPPCVALACWLPLSRLRSQLGVCGASSTQAESHFWQPNAAGARHCARECHWRRHSRCETWICVFTRISGLKVTHYFAGPGHGQATLAFAFRCVLLIVARAISTHNELWANTGVAEESLQMSCCRHYSRCWHAKHGCSSHYQCWRLRQGSCVAAHRRQPLAGHSCAPRMWALQASCAARRLRSRLEAAAWMRHSST